MVASRPVVVGPDFADRVVRAVNEQARVQIDRGALARAEALLASRSVAENAKRAVATQFVSRDSSHSTFRPPTDADGPQPHPDARPSWDVGPGPGRPFELVRRYGTFYPGIWQQVDALRQARWWPRWCFLPIAQARKLDNGRLVSHHNIDKIVNAGVLLASWRLSKGVYVFNHDFLRELKGTELGSIPTETVFRMPEQCVYIPVSWPPASHPIGEVHGFFAQLQLNDRDAIPQLALCFDTTDGGLWSWMDLIPNNKLDWPDDELSAMTRRALRLLLYLCTDEPDIDGTPRGEVQPTKTKKGLRWFPPEKIAVWNVGVRLGATFRKTHEASEREQTTEGSEGEGRPHGRPRPHVRRAHFHNFWIGPKNQPEKRRLVSRWVHDVPVNVKSADDLVTTVRPVEEPGDERG